MSSPEEVLQFQRDVASSAGVSVGETYTSQLGGVEWLCMDWTMNEFTFSVASAMIDGKCYACLLYTSCRVYCDKRPCGAKGLRISQN